MTPGEYDFPTQYAGDTARSRQFTVQRKFLSTNQTQPIPLTDAVIEMDVKPYGKDTAVLELTTVGDAGITITDAANGVFVVGGYTLPDDKRPLLYDIQITFADGERRTFLRGCFPIMEQITT